MKLQELQGIILNTKTVRITVMDQSKLIRATREPYNYIEVEY